MEIFLNAIDVLIRSVTSILFLFLITKFMGRKQMTQLSFFDYVIGISIGSIAASMATTQEMEYLHGFLSMSVYAIIDVIISLLTNKSIKFRRFINGKAFLLICNGKVLNKNITKAKYDINDLLSDARLAGYFDISDIKYAFMEQNGRVSFLPKSNKTPIVQEDMNIVKPQNGLVANVILDGKIMYENLKSIGLNEVWLKSQLKIRKQQQIEEIFLATVDSNKVLTVYKKTNELISKTCID